jgi:hypothetical protein
MSRLEKEIQARIMQKSYLKTAVPGSTPVISFGDFTKARIATIGINPSSKEFQIGGSNPRLIPGLDSKRLEDYESLQISRASEIGLPEANKIWKGCQSYFERNPYGWFDHFEPILSMFNASYKDGTATHLDLSQTATSKAWSALTAKERIELLDEDLDFFRWQNSQPNINIRLINGQTAINQVKKLRIFDLTEDKPIKIPGPNGKSSCRTFVGVGTQGEKVLAWSTNIPAMRVTNTTKSAAAKAIGIWAQQASRI